MVGFEGPRKLRIRDVMSWVAGLALALAPLCRALRDSPYPGLLILLWLIALPLLLPTAFLGLVAAGTMLGLAKEAGARIWAAGLAAFAIKVDGRRSPPG